MGRPINAAAYCFPSAASRAYLLSRANSIMPNFYEASKAPRLSELWKYLSELA